MAYSKRTVEPAREPVTLNEVKRQARITFDDDDGMIARYIATARQQAEEILSKALITQTWQSFLDCYPAGDEIVLARPPVQSISHVVSIESDDTETTFAASNYFLADADGKARIVLKEGSSWPAIDLKRANGVRIEYVAGFGDSAYDIPEEVRQWILIRATDLYEGRESTIVGRSTAERSFVDQLLVNHRSYAL